MISKTYEHTLIFAYFYEWNFEDKEKLFLLAARVSRITFWNFVIELFYYCFILGFSDFIATLCCLQAFAV